MYLNIFWYILISCTLLQIMNALFEVQKEQIKNDQNAVAVFDDFQSNMTNHQIFGRHIQQLLLKPTKRPRWQHSSVPGLLGALWQRRILFPWQMGDLKMGVRAFRNDSYQTWSWIGTVGIVGMLVFFSKTLLKHLLVGVTGEFQTGKLYSPGGAAASYISVRKRGEHLKHFGWWSQMNQISWF